MRYENLLITFFKKPPLIKIALIIIGISILSFLKLSYDFSKDGSAGLATLVINFETEKRVFEGEVAGNMTMLDALNLAVSVGKIKFNYAIDKSGDIHVAEIDGHTNGFNNKYFIFYLNSKTIPAKDLNRKIIHKRDKIEVGLQQI